mmetsp:Transcript_13401/g.15544  ORF Transcript_13401/g.15544 Transcript_13401/m.15544 type:complete len:90 (+) Transcript_13401:262-531(+)
MTGKNDKGLNPFSYLHNDESLSKFRKEKSSAYQDAEMESNELKNLEIPVLQEEISPEKPTLAQNSGAINRMFNSPLKAPPPTHFVDEFD